MTTEQTKNLRQGDVIGIKTPYLDNKHSNCFPQVAVVIRKTLNNFIVVEDVHGIPSIWRNTELDLLEKN